MSGDDAMCTRLPNQASIFTAELKAIDLALDLIEREGYWRYIIFTDSLSAMQALEHNNDSLDSLINDILNRISRMCEDATIMFCWLPSHVGIAGNEKYHDNTIALFINPNEQTQNYRVCHFQASWLHFVLSKYPSYSVFAFIINRHGRSSRDV